MLRALFAVKLGICEGHGRAEGACAIVGYVRDLCTGALGSLVGCF